jgi:hypothetical protein
MPRFAPPGAKKDRAERLAREAKEAKKRTMASQHTRRHQPGESYQDEGTNTLSTTPTIFGRVIPTILLCILLLLLCVMIFRCFHSHDFVMCFDCCVACFDISLLLPSCLSVLNMGKRAIGTITFFAERSKFHLCTTQNQFRCS